MRCVGQLAPLALAFSLKIPESGCHCRSHLCGKAERISYHVDPKLNPSNSQFSEYLQKDQIQKWGALKSVSFSALSEASGQSKCLLVQEYFGSYYGQDWIEFYYISSCQSTNLSLVVGRVHQKSQYQDWLTIKYPNSKGGIHHPHCWPTGKNQGVRRSSAGPNEECRQMRQLISGRVWHYLKGRAKFWLLEELLSALGSRHGAHRRGPGKLGLGSGKRETQALRAKPQIQICCYAVFADWPAFDYRMRLLVGMCWVIPWHACCSSLAFPPESPSLDQQPGSGARGQCGPRGYLFDETHSPQSRFADVTKHVFSVFKDELVGISNECLTDQGKHLGGRTKLLKWGIFICHQLDEKREAPCQSSGGRGRWHLSWEQH